MAPPRKTQARSRAGRKAKKNIPVGRAYVKTSFNNTFVTLTDRQGEVIVTSVKDISPQAHNGCRPKARRRV